VSGIVHTTDGRPRAAVVGDRRMLAERDVDA
jgi:hypothetical protein